MDDWSEALALYMRRHTCQSCQYQFSEADRAWDRAIESAACPECSEALPGFSSLAKLATPTRITYPSSDDERGVQSLHVSIVKPDGPPRFSELGPIGVGGWLLLLILQMSLIGPLIGAGQIYTELYILEHAYPALVSLSKWATYRSAIWWTFWMTTGLRVFGAWGLATGRDWSVVRRAKIVLWAGPVGALICVGLAPLVMDVNVETAITRQVVASFMGSVTAASIWTTYLSKSKRVRARFAGLTACEPARDIPESCEDRLYTKIAEELDRHTVDQGLWTKAYAQAGGDDRQTRVLYIKARFARLIAGERSQ